MKINMQEIELIGGREKNPDIDHALHILELNNLVEEEPRAAPAEEPRRDWPEHPEWMAKPSDFNKPDKTYWTGQPTKGGDWGHPLTQEQAYIYAMTPLPFVSYVATIGMGMFTGVLSLLTGGSGTGVRRR